MLILIRYCFRRMLEELTLREQEYLEFIRQKNVPLHNDVINKLKEDFEQEHPYQKGYYWCKQTF